MRKSSSLGGMEQMLSDLRKSIWDYSDLRIYGLIMTNRIDCMEALSKTSHRDGFISLLTAGMSGQPVTFSVTFDTP